MLVPHTTAARTVSAGNSAAPKAFASPVADTTAAGGVGAAADCAAAALGVARSRSLIVWG